MSTTRKISFPLEAVFQSAVQDADNVEIWRLLTRHVQDLNVNHPNHVGLTALHQGVLNNNLDSIKMLLGHGANVNAADMNGFTPLHTASACGYLAASSLLLIQGADVFQLTQDGDLPVDLAKDTATARMLTDEMVRQIHQRTFFKAWLVYKAKEVFSVCVKVTLQLMDVVGQFMESRHKAKQLKCGIQRPNCIGLSPNRSSDKRPKLSSIECKPKQKEQNPTEVSATTLGRLDSEANHFKED